MNDSKDNIKGAFMMMGTMAGFVINDAFMRVVLETLPLFQAIFLRGSFLIPMIVFLAWRGGALRYTVLPIDIWRIRLRTLCELIGTFLFLTALTLLPFAEISAIMQALPLAVTVGAVVFLGAPIGWRRLSAILVGFVGVLIIIRPGSEAFSPYSLMVLAVVLVVVVRDLAARVLSPGIPSTLVALHAAIWIAIANGALSLTAPWAAISGQSALFLALAALSLTAGYIFGVAAMRIGDIATIAPFRYTSLLWAILLGTVVFGEALDTWTITGAAIVVAMGLFSLYREQVVKRHE